MSPARPGPESGLVRAQGSGLSFGKHEPGPEAQGFLQYFIHGPSDIIINFVVPKFAVFLEYSSTTECAGSADRRC